MTPARMTTDPLELAAQVWGLAGALGTLAIAATSAEDNEQRAEALFDAIVGQGARLPSQRRFEARARSEANGVNVPAPLLAEVKALIRA